MGKKMVAKEDLATYFSSSPPNNQQMSMLEKEIQTFKTTNQKSEEEMKKIREDMNKFVAKNAQHSHDVAEQLTSLGRISFLNLILVNNLIWKKKYLGFLLNNRTKII